MIRDERKITISLPTWDSAGAVAAISVAVGVSCWVVFEWVPWRSLWRDSAAPAWIQAVGSVIGILLAVAIPAMQHRAAEKAARGTVNAETLRRIEVLVELVAHATNTALMIYDRRGNANLRESESDRVSQREMVDQLTVYMRDISTMDLPTSTTIRCLGKMRGFLTIMRDLIGPPSAQAIPGSAAYAADWLVPLRHFSNTLLDLIEDGDDFGGRLMEGKSALLQRSADALTAAKAAQR